MIELLADLNTDITEQIRNRCILKGLLTLVFYHMVYRDHIHLLINKSK